MAITVVQSKHLSQLNGASLALSFDSAPSVGNRIVVLTGDNLVGVDSVSDNKGHLYSNDYAPSPTQYELISWSALVGTSGGTFTVTFASDANAAVMLYIMEVSGIDDEVDVTKSNTGTLGTLTTGVSASTIYDVEFVLSFGMSSGTVVFVPTVGVDLGSETTSRSGTASYRVTSNTGTQSETWTGSPVVWETLLVSYKGTIPPPLPTFQMSSAQ